MHFLQKISLKTALELSSSRSKKIKNKIMKLTLAILSLICCGCLGIDVSENKHQKRSISDFGLYSGSYGVSSFGLPSSSYIGAPTISSHTHTHSTSIVEKPVAVPVPSISAPSFYSSSILPSTSILSTPSVLPSTSILSSSSILPSTYGFSSYPLRSVSSYPLNIGYPSFSKYYSGLPKYGSSVPTTTVYKKSFYSSPILKYSKW